MTGTVCRIDGGEMTPTRPDIPDTALGQACYMASLAEQLRGLGAGPAPATAVSDICHAVAVIGLAVASASEAYRQGLSDGSKGRAAAQEMSEE